MSTFVFMRGGSNFNTRCKCSWLTLDFIFDTFYRTCESYRILIFDLYLIDSFVNIDLISDFLDPAYLYSTYNPINSNILKAFELIN